MTRIPLLQQVEHVFEILHVPALVGGDGNGLHIFLDGAIDYLLHRAVVAQVNHLGPAGLQYAAHDVDRRIVPVEEGCSGDNPDVVPGFVDFGGVHRYVSRS